MWFTDLLRFDCGSGGSPRWLHDNEDLPMAHREGVPGLNAIALFGL